MKSKFRKAAWASIVVVIALVVIAGATGGLAPLGVKAGNTAPTTTTTVATTTTTTPSSSDLTPPSSLFPNSIFNKNVQSWSAGPNSSEFAADIVTDYKKAFGTVGVNTNRSTYEVPANQPMVPLYVQAGCHNFTPNTGPEAPVPPNAVPGNSSDAPLIIYQPSSDYEWEFWQAAKDGPGWSACWGGKLRMTTSDGVFSSPYGLSASGISYLATEITEADVASGSIDHAIAMEVTDCNWPDDPNYVYPADRTDCGTNPGQPAEGQWFRFPANLAMPSGLTPFGQMVFKAIQTYGAVIVDQGGAVMLEAESNGDWAAEGNSGTDPITASWDGKQEYQVVANLPWGQLQTIDPPQS
jgi:hypothetical protein